MAFRRSLRSAGRDGQAKQKVARQTFQNVTPNSSDFLYVRSEDRGKIRGWA